jgi:hypothetical protein
MVVSHMIHTGIQNKSAHMRTHYSWKLTTHIYTHTHIHIHTHTRTQESICHTY